MNMMKNDNNEALLEMGFSEGKHVKRRRERMALKNRKYKSVNPYAERNLKKTNVSKAISSARKLHDKWRNPIIEDEYNEHKPSQKVTWKSLGMKPSVKSVEGDVWPRGLSGALSPFRKGSEPVVWDPHGSKNSEPEPQETYTKIYTEIYTEIKPRWRQRAEEVLQMMRAKLGV